MQAVARVHHSDQRILPSAQRWEETAYREPGPDPVSFPSAVVITKVEAFDIASVAHEAGEYLSSVGSRAMAQALEDVVVMLEARLLGEKVKEGL